MNNDTTYIPISSKKKPVCLCCGTSRSIRYTMLLSCFIKTTQVIAKGLCFAKIVHFRHPCAGRDPFFRTFSFTSTINYFLALLLCVILLTPDAYAADKKLYVFYPLTTRPQVVQEILQDNLKNVSVTVFGRFNDFKAKIEIDPPDMILTKPVLIKQMSEYTIVANAIRKGSSIESYVLLTIDTPLDMQSVTSEITIGAIDMLGRNAMKTFIGQFFPVQPKLKRVTKVEDLLPLLSFTMANGILIEEVFVDYFKRTSNLNFKVSPTVPTKFGILALGCSINDEKHSHEISETLKKGSNVINTLFEVDKWK